MSDYTKNYNLKKPYPDDFFDVNDFNGNADIIDASLNKLNVSINNLDQKTNIIDDSLTNLSNSINNLDEKIDSVSDDIANNISKNVEDFTEGILPIARGGTGTNSTTGIRNNIGLGTTSSVQFNSLTVSSLTVNNQTLNLIYTQETQPTTANKGSLWAW